MAFARRRANAKPQAVKNCTGLSPPERAQYPLVLKSTQSAFVGSLEEIMNRLLVASVLVVGLLPGVCAALEISNVLPRYGPYGATRPNLKCLPKDVIIITYDLAGLTVDKSGKAKYTTLLEILNDKQKVIFSNETTPEPKLQLGGGKMPGELNVQVGAKQAKGNYTIRITVTDLLDKNKANAGKTFSYPYEVLPDTFGLAAVRAPAFGVVGTRYAPEFALANWTLDKKNQPKGEVSIRVLDAKGAEVDFVKHSLPAYLLDLPPIDLTEVNAVPFSHLIYLNRPGRFTVEISAEDKLGNTKVQMSYPFTVIDTTAVAK